MQQDKSLLPIDGRPLIHHVYEQLAGRFAEILTSSNDPEKYRFLGLPVIADEVPGQGPLMGLASALRASANELSFVVACDNPRLNPATIRRLFAAAPGCDIVIPRDHRQRAEPLFAIYRKSCQPALDRVLRQGGRRISDVFESCRVRFLDLPDDESLINLNTPADVHAYLAWRSNYLRS